MAPQGAKTQSKSTTEVATDLWQLVRDYAKQETIDPLKSLGRFFGYGLAGAVLVSVGLVFAVLAILRVLQNETGSRLTGSWNFVPYVVAIVLAGIVAGLCVRAITKPNRSGDR